MTLVLVYFLFYFFNVFCWTYVFKFPFICLCLIFAAHKLLGLLGSNNFIEQVPVLVLALPSSLFVHAGSIDLILKILQIVFLEP